MPFKAKKDFGDNLVPQKISLPHFTSHGDYQPVYIVDIISANMPAENRAQLKVDSVEL